MSSPQTLRELWTRYLAHADEYYRSPPDLWGNREPTGELTNIRDALRWIERYGDEPLSWLEESGGGHGGDLLFSTIDAMLRRPKAAPPTRGGPPTRGYINSTIMRLRRMFRWAAKRPRRWISAAVIAEMELVDGLKYGRSNARELPPRQPCPESLYIATLAALAEESLKPERSKWARKIAAMLEIQWHSGMRPCEVAQMARSEITIEQPPQFSLQHAPPGTFHGVEVMVYRPFLHKTRHHGYDRNIFLGPEARRLVEDWMKAMPCRDSLFKITAGGYAQALRRIAKEHKLATIAPNTIRHAFATRLRAVSGIDVVQVLMGHRHRATTEIYARPDAAAAIDAIWRFG